MKMKSILSFVVLLALSGQIGYSYPANQCCGLNYVGTCSHCPLTATTITTGPMQCEPGYTLQDDRCIRIVENLQCPPGSVLRGNTCLRETTVQPSCPQGTILENGRCVRTFERTCPYGYHLENGICVYSEVVPITCPPGTYQRGNECIQVKCPPDYQMENGWCVRIATNPQPPQLTPTNLQSPQLIATATNLQSPCQYNNCPTCPGQCPLTATTITTGTMQCEPGYTLQDGRCIRIVESLQCPPGSVLRGNTCFRETTTQPSCPQGTIFENGRCVQTFERTCPYGYHLENGTCMYSEVVPISCPPGTYQRGNECIQVKCPPDHQLENGRCVRIATNPQPPCQYNCQTGDNTVSHREIEIIECEEGYVRRGDHCEKITCPTSTSWNGEHCSHHLIGGNTTNILNNTNIVNNINNVTHDTNVNLNNVNNVYIYKGGEVVHVTNETRAISPPALLPPVQVPIPPPQPEKCCIVQSPRLCQKQSGSRWRCFNRKYSRCGSFCTQPVIQLRPPMPIYRSPTLVMPPQPPITPSCGTGGCSRMDCSGCETGGYCAPSCYQYSCQDGCEYADHGSFCESHSGPGCDEADGYYY